MEFDFQKGPIRFIKGGRYPFCHSVLVDDEIRAVIDASSDEQKLRAFKDEGPVQFLITSHAHEDHLVFNYLFPESQFCTHPLDAPYFGSLDSLIDSFGEMSSTERQKWKGFLREKCHYRERAVDLLLEEGMVLELGSVRLEVIHTPGHTKGHLAFYFPGEKILFTGDLDLTKAGPYYADRASSVEDIIRSLKRLRNYPAEVYLTGHGRGVLEGDPAYIDEYLNVVFSREDKLVDFLKRGPKNLSQVVAEGIIYGKNPKTIGAWDLALSERRMMIKHLERLVEMNLVRREGDLFILAP